MIAVFGGYGTFGSQVSRMLAAAGLAVRIAGRDEELARRFAESLGPGHEGLAADADDPVSCLRALAGARIAVLCAGPFSRMSLTLPHACLDSGVHYVDIADDRGWFSRLSTLDDRFRERELTAARGCSSLPGISGALACLAAERLGAVERARVTLFIGNANPKGEAAVVSAGAQAGRPFPAPQGRLHGFRGRETVMLPAPFGRRGVYDWESPELDLFPTLLGAREVRVKVGFESRSATRAFAMLARLGPRWSGLLVPVLATLGKGLSGFGHSGGVVQVELFAPEGTSVTFSLGGPDDGQRMAALPAVFVAMGLADGTVTRRGGVTAYEALGAEALTAKLSAAGFTLTSPSSRRCTGAS